MTYPIDTSRSSPNHSSRFGAVVRMIVLHATAGSYISSLNWLCSPESRVSSHYLIRKDGHIAQLVPDDQAAWHAGASFWRGMASEQIQLTSIGVELENLNTGRDPYPQAQLSALTWLCRRRIADYSIARASVVRHLDIAVPHGRKTDPAGLTWPGFADRLYTVPRANNYRVKAAVTGGATIRSGPYRNAHILGRLRAGDAWEGEQVKGGQVSAPGFGSGNIWVMAPDGRAVWAGLLEGET